MRVPTAAQATELARLDVKLAELRKTLETPTAELDAAQQQWEQNYKSLAWQTLRPETLESIAGAKLDLKEDGSVLVSGEHAATDTYTLTIDNPPANMTAIRLEVLAEDSLPAKGPGRGENGNFVLTEFEIAFRAADSKEDQSVPIAAATATFAQQQFGKPQSDGTFAIDGTIDGNTKAKNFGWAVMPKFGQTHEAVYETKADVAGGTGSTLVVKLVQNYTPSPRHTIGRFRLSAVSGTRPVKAGGGIPEELAKIIATAGEARSPEQREKLATYYRSIAPCARCGADRTQGDRGGQADR